MFRIDQTDPHDSAEERTSLTASYAVRAGKYPFYASIRAKRQIQLTRQLLEYSRIVRSTRMVTDCSSCFGSGIRLPWEKLYSFRITSTARHTGRAQIGWSGERRSGGSRAASTNPGAPRRRRSFGWCRITCSGSRRFTTSASRASAARGAPWSRWSRTRSGPRVAYASILRDARQAGAPTTAGALPL